MKDLKINNGFYQDINMDETITPISLELETPTPMPEDPIENAVL